MASYKKKSSLQNFLIKDMDNHCISIKELTERLETDLDNGLSSEQAEKILAKDGPNTLNPRRFAFTKLSVRGMFAPFTLTMAIASVLCFVIYGIHQQTKAFDELDFVYYGFILMVVAMINGCTYSFQLKAEAKTLNSLQFLWPRFAFVIRDGCKKTMPFARLVKGDIVELHPGRRVPADVRLIEAHNLKIDDSVITQRQLPQEKDTSSSSSVPLRSKNMAFFGTHCVEGYGKGIVVATGNWTMIGKIARLMSYLDDNPMPPLADEIADFEVNMFLLILIGTSIFTAFFFFKYTLVDYFIFWVAMIVGNIPEGLVPCIGFVLIVLAKRLANMKLIVKNLMTVDTLGLTSALCIGKTGTLTKNEKKVSHVWVDNKIYSVQDSSDGAGIDEFLFSESWFEFSRGAVLSNTVSYTVRDKEAQDKKSVEESSDFAMLEFSEQKVGKFNSFRECHKKVFDNNFNPTDGFSMAVYKMKLTDGTLEYAMFLKGAPELLFQKCSTILLDGVTRSVDNAIAEDFYKALEDLAGRAETPIGFFDYSFPIDEFPPGKPFKSSGVVVPSSGLRFLGLLSISDPPKYDVAQHIVRCREAGIKIILATGAHPTTTKTIAEEIGIATAVESVTRIVETTRLPVSTHSCDQQAAMVSGLTFQGLDPDDLNVLLSRHNVLLFARMTPHQKFLIVDILQKEGYMVALTGETTMDVVSIKKADVGIAMGISSSDAINEAADLILLDRNFKNIVDGIEVGRLFYTNLKKIIVFSLSQHLPECIPFFLNILFEYPMPLLSKSFLCLNIGIDILPAVALGFERAEEDLMLRPALGRRRESLISFSLIFQTYFLFGVYETAAAYLANFIVIAEDGFLEDKIWGIKDKWETKCINDLEDSYGQEWTYTARTSLENAGQTAFFITVVVMQLINAFICKTWRTSIFKHGMSNWYLNGSLIFSILLALTVVYAPFMNNFIHTVPLRLHIWMTGVPFGFLLFLAHEVCLHFLRQLPQGSWFEREVFY